MKRPRAASAGDRFAAVVARYGLDDRQAQVLARYLDILAEHPHAATAVRDRAAAVDVHLADSLAGLGALDAATAAGGSPYVVDIGSGAGLPGIPLAVARPQLRFDLAEATQRKCGFLVEVVDTLHMFNVEVRCARAEELPAQAFRESYGVALARAVAPLATLVEYAAPLLGPAGRLVAWKGRRDPVEEAAGAAAADVVGLESLGVEPVQPYEQSRDRHLYLYRKVRSCPPGFPRRPGVARRKPLQ